MNMSDIFEKIIVPLIAAFVGAGLTFWYQKREQKKLYKINLLATLMAYRFAGPTDVEFVKALNMVDIVFHNNAKVKDLLHKYFEYTKYDVYSGGERVIVLFELLLEMGKDIGYTDLKRSDISDFYVPAPPPKNEGNSDTTKP